MKKKVLLSVVSLMAMFGMASCGGESTSSASAPSTEVSDTSVSDKVSDSTTSSPSSVAPSTVTLTSLAINNKTAFTGLHAGDANVKLDLGIAPAGNVAALVNSGAISITSSNTAVGVVNGLYFSPVGAGETVITVSSGSLSDTVTVTVEESLSAPAYVKDKTLHEVWTMDNDAGAKAYVVTGTVKSFKSGSEAYGSLYLSSDDETDGDIYVYGCNAKASSLAYSLSDKAYKFTNPKDFNSDAATKDIKVGDKITMLAIRSDYKTTKEIVGVVLAVDGKPVSNGALTTDEVQAVANDKTFAYTVTGKITKWTSGSDGGAYGNFSIKTEGATGDELIVYGATGTKGALAFTDGANVFTNAKDFLTNSITKDLKVGDEITMLAIRADYNDTIEIQGIVLSDEDIPTVTEVTDLAELTEPGTTYLAKGVVAATNTKGFVLSDGTHSAYVHMNAVPTVAIGDYVSVEAALSEYNGQIQLNGSVGTVTTLTTGTAPTVPTAIDLTKEIADGFAADTYTYAVADTALYKWNSTIGKAGSYFTMPVEGSDTLIEPAYLDSTKFALAEGKNYDLEGFFIGYNTKYNYAVFMVTKAELKETSATGLTLSAPMTEVAQGGTMQITPVFTPSNATDALTWTSSYEKATVVDGLVTVAEDAVIGTEVTITATSNVNASVTAECKFTIKKELTAAEKYGTADAPITVAQALATMEEEMPNANDTIDANKLYVKGIAKTVSYNSKYGSYTAYLVDSLSDTVSLQVYSGKFGDGVTAMSQNDIVTANGYAKNYNGTLEMCGVNNVYPEFSEVIRGNSTITVDAPEGVTVTGLDATAVNGSTASFTVAVPEGKKVDAVKIGTTEITAVDGTYSFTVDGDATVTITIKDASAPEAVTVYSTGFESADGFTATTSYKNTTEAKYGTEGKQWATICGAPSATKIDGSQSLQLRYYSDVNNNPEAYMCFDAANVSEISFNYMTKVVADKFTVKYSSDSGSTWNDIETVDGSKTASSYTHTFDAPVASFRLKVEFTTHAADKNYLLLDSVVLGSFN